jgi:hypothetical protein
MKFRGYTILPLGETTTNTYDLFSKTDIERLEHLKAKKRVKIAFESERFIIYTYKVDDNEISVNFNGKELVEWSKEQLKGVIVQ